MGKRIREGKLVDDERQGHEMRSRAERERERGKREEEEVAACGCNNVGPMSPGTPGRTLYLLMRRGTALCTRYKLII